MNSFNLNSVLSPVSLVCHLASRRALPSSPLKRAVHFRLLYQGLIISCLYSLYLSCWNSHHRHARPSIPTAFNLFPTALSPNSSSSSSSVHTTQHTIQPTTPPNHNNRLSSAVPWSQSAKRKVLRLRRPSSSGSGHPGSRELPPLPIHKSSAPPRPPRNPARVKLASRPSTSSGVPDASNSRSIPRPHALSDSRVHKSVGDSVSWEFPLPTGSEFPLQRKKSRSSKGSAPSTHNATAKNDAQFSTVDRTILDQLRRKVQAREEQFILRNGKKHHAFSAKEVPYPRSYERHVIDLDVCTPTKVLDIGCGTGTWILDAARQWKNTHFVGLDIVPLHPDLMQIGSLDLASRITWVQANFLEGLPFPNEEFDYVRFTRIARGVPEDKWDDLFEEITRVMKPGTAFELLEEDLYFPGRLRDSASPSPSSRTPQTTPPSTPSRTKVLR
ncbi:Demethylmenaquinone methyltransferase [Grifola frondosa]|uniref:Demethylmenaquinone methyltransferase n=1 Tax=Grifola frondosa TaxID=5627 RepID=A0A1C7LVZ9_GRIFR|nr:Demethylmenaquinone methyltransferase [Grifola frondosa]